MSRAPATEQASGVRVGVVSLGCPKNLVDTEVMLGHLAGQGCSIVRDVADAEVVLVNTCAFIDAAREESVQTILELAERKQTGSLKRLVVAGCLVQRYRDELAASLPEVDAFIGLDELAEVGAAICGPSAPHGAAALRMIAPRPAATLPDRAWSASRYLYDERTPRVLAGPGWSAYVKIAEGCDHTCAFCAIPSFRGRFRSRSIDSVLHEVRTLVDGGVREVNLIAQDTSHFGRDRDGGEDLARLLHALDPVPGLRWLRLHYLYPNSVTAALIEAMSVLPRVVPYVDMPLQHADRAVLQRMRRGGSGAAHQRLLERFRRAIPGVGLRSTFIVGFPGETEREFRGLEAFVERAGLDHVGVFLYSHEESTSAVALADDVPPEVKAERRQRLLAIQERSTLARHRSWLGRRVVVLVEGAHPETEHLLVGRLATQAPDVDGQVLLNDGFARPGAFVEVELTDLAGADLVGAILGPA